MDFRWVDALPEEQRIKELKQYLERIRDALAKPKKPTKKEQEANDAKKQELNTGERLLAKLEEELTQFEHEKEQQETRMVEVEEPTPETPELAERINEQPPEPALDQLVGTHPPADEGMVRDAYQPQPTYKSNNPYENNETAYVQPEPPHEDFRQEYQKSAVEKIVDKYKN